MARQPDKETSARIICAQHRITIIEHDNGSLRFVGQGLDFKVRCWADLALSDLKTRRVHY